MEIREKLNEHPALVAAILVVALAIVALLVYLTRPRARGDDDGGAPHQVWFVDLNDSQRFTADDTLASVKRDTGDFEGMPSGVRAYVFACGSCADEGARFVGYFERFTPVVLDRLKTAKITRYHQLGDPPPSWVEPGRMRRAVDGGAWYAASSDEGRYIETELYKKCPGRDITECRP